jgi:hypothetical protein
LCDDEYLKYYGEDYGRDYGKELYFLLDKFQIADDMELCSFLASAFNCEVVGIVAL